MSQRICDFCSAPNPTWVFGCQSYEMPELHCVSDSDWLACDQCTLLIQAGRWRDLEEVCVAKTTTGRVLTEMIGKEGAMAEVGKLHSEFRKHRTGEPRKIYVRGAV